MDVFFKIIGGGFLSVVILVIFAAVFAFPVMWLWNWLMPSIFGLPGIGFWQALGLNIFSGLLLGRSSFSVNN